MPFSEPSPFYNHIKESVLEQFDYNLFVERLKVINVPETLGFTWADKHRAFQKKVLTLVSAYLQGNRHLADTVVLEENLKKEWEAFYHRTYEGYALFSTSDDINRHINEILSGVFYYAEGPDAHTGHTYLVDRDKMVTYMTGQTEAMLRRADELTQPLEKTHAASIKCFKMRLKQAVEVYRQSRFGPSALAHFKKAIESASDSLVRHHQTKVDPTVLDYIQSIGLILVGMLIGLVTFPLLLSSNYRNWLGVTFFSGAKPRFIDSKDSQLVEEKLKALNIHGMVDAVQSEYMPFDPSPSRQGVSSLSAAS